MDEIFEWAVVGAGPAGIASIGKLLDAAVHPKQIVWIDPQFKVGDFGNAWSYVNSNTSVESFLKFYQNCDAFGFATQRKPFLIDKASPTATCPLMVAAEPLRWMTQALQNQVISIQDQVTCITAIQNFWQLTLASKQTIQSKKIILAIGANAKELEIANTKTMPLAIALNPIKLATQLQTTDTVCLFGSAQSAKSVIENLAKIKTQKNILFYRSERSLERHLQDIDLSHMECLPATAKNLLQHIPHCNKAIYAIGFERRHIPIIGLPTNYGYDTKTGEIAPGIFGLGIAFPETLPYELGQREYRVTAVWPFMKRLNKLLPSWLA